MTPESLALKAPAGQEAAFRGGPLDPDGDFCSTASGYSVAIDETEGLRRRVRLFLDGSNLPSLRFVRVEVDGDVIRLRGKVRSFYEKQMAVQLVSRVAGVIRVIDQIDVPAMNSFARRRLAEGA